MRLGGGGGRGGGHPDPEIRVFRPFGRPFGLKINGGGGDPSLKISNKSDQGALNFCGFFKAKNSDLKNKKLKMLNV